MTETEMLTTALAEAQARLEELDRKWSWLVDLPLCRRQLPDGHVPGNTEEALAAWVRTADDLMAENARLRRALDAAGFVLGSDPTAPREAVELEEIEG